MIPVPIFLFSFGTKENADTLIGMNKNANPTALASFAPEPHAGINLQIPTGHYKQRHAASCTPKASRYLVFIATQNSHPPSIMP